MSGQRPKIAFIGAGSTVFARNLIGDILSYPELGDCHIALHDLDPERLRVSEAVAVRIALMLGRGPGLRARPTATAPSTAPTTPST